MSCTDSVPLENMTCEDLKAMKDMRDMCGISQLSFPVVTELHMPVLGGMSGCFPTMIGILQCSYLV